MTQDPVLYSEARDIARITLNVPRRKNALTAEAINELAKAWARFEAGPAQVAILTGSDGSFCAGLDLETLPDPAPAVPGIGADVTKPVIAAISGPAVGLGLTLTMQADLAVADNTAFFRYPESQIGFTGGLIAGLAARVTTKSANEILFLGERIDAKRAAEIGLINNVVTPEKLMDRAEEMAGIIAGSAPMVIRALKQEMNAVVPASPAQTSGQFRARMSRIADSADRKEGLAAFREKRRPKFTGE